MTRCRDESIGVISYGVVEEVDVECRASCIKCIWATTIANKVKDRLKPTDRAGANAWSLVRKKM